jgi:hypothetical protein
MLTCDGPLGVFLQNINRRSLSLAVVEFNYSNITMSIRDVQWSRGAGRNIASIKY